VNDITWTTDWVVHDDDQLLEKGELVEINVDLTGISVDLGINTEFTIEMKPPKGSALSIQRMTPAYIDLVMNLQ
jgi:archaellin